MILPTLRRWLTGTDVKTFANPPERCRPPFGLERLEAREVPAVLYVTGEDGYR